MPLFCREILETPVGPMVAVASPDALCALEYNTRQRLSLLAARLRRWYGSPTIVTDDNVWIARTKLWLSGYFAGRMEGLPVIPLDLRGTPFELSVWKAMGRIPAGSTISYGELARRVGAPQAARAAGGAARRNPISLIVPCHRVVGCRGTLTGYGGGTSRKEWLLRHEGTLGGLPEMMGTGDAAHPHCLALQRPV